MVRKISLVAGLIVCALASISRADWQPPADGALTDKQVTAYLSVTREMLQQLKAAGKATEGANGLAGAAILQRADANVKASIAKAGLTEAEYQWAGERVWEARGYLMSQDLSAKTEAEFVERLKKSDEEQAALKQKLASAGAAAREGKKILTPERRAEIIAAAKADQAAADEEAKVHKAEWKQAATDAAQAESDAKTAESAAKRVPKEMKDEERQNYIEEKTRTGVAFRTAAREAREKEVEARKIFDEYTAKSDMAAWRGANPDVPVTPEEKAEIAKQNEEAIAAIKSDLQTAGQASDLMKQAVTEFRKQMAAVKDQPGVKNAAIVKAHNKEFDEIFLPRK